MRFLGWLAAYILVYLLRDIVFVEGSAWLIVTYMVTFPLGAVFTIVMRILMNIPMRDMLPSMVIIAIILLVMDGVSFGFTDIYEMAEHEMSAAAYLLWVPGIFLIVALWLMNRAQQSS